MRRFPLIVYLLALLIGCDGTGATSTTGGAAGVSGSAGEAGSGGIGGTEMTTSSTAGQAGSGGSGAVAGSGGAGGSGACSPTMDDGNPCTNDAIAGDGCTVVHAAKPEAEICSVDAQIGSCVSGNCIVGLLPLPACPSISAAPTSGWIAQLVPLENNVKLAGAAAIVPLLNGCSDVPRKIRLSVPVDPASAQGQSPDGVPVARELVIDPATAWKGDGLPWLGARHDGLLPYVAGSAVWIELEMPAGACAATCSTGAPGFTCSTADANALHTCAPAASFMLAPLGF